MIIIQYFTISLSSLSSTKSMSFCFEQTQYVRIKVERAVTSVKGVNRASVLCYRRVCLSLLPHFYSGDISKNWWIRKWKCQFPMKIAKVLIESPHYNIPIVQYFNPAGCRWWLYFRPGDFATGTFISVSMQCFNSVGCRWWLYFTSWDFATGAFVPVSMFQLHCIALFQLCWM